MNQNLQHILDLINKSSQLSEDDKTIMLDALKKANKDLVIAEFKLERTNKVKRTTGILLEETIQELEQKRAAIEETNTALNRRFEIGTIPINSIGKNGELRRTHRGYCARNSKPTQLRQ